MAAKRPASPSRAKPCKLGRRDGAAPPTEGLRVTEAEFMFLQLLAHSGVPDAVILLVARLQRTVPWCERATVDHLEFFAGCKSVTRAFCRANLRALSYEKLDNPMLDMTSATGFLAAVTLVLRLKFGAAALAAPVCSSWVWMSRGTTRRQWYAPMGDVLRSSSVREGNLMVSRLVVLIYIMSAMGVIWLVEQPANSLLQWHPRWQELLASIDVWRHHLFMGDFGGESAKPTWIYAPVPWVTDLERYRTKHTCGKVENNLQVTKVSTRADGSTAVAGGKDLKGTQAYPEAFGRAVCNLMSDHRAEREAVAVALRDNSFANKSAAQHVRSLLAGAHQLRDPWVDASLGEVMALTDS